MAIGILRGFGPEKEVKVMMKEGSKKDKAVKAWMDWRPAIVSLLSLFGVGVLPDILKGLYEPYSAELVAAHVPLFMLFIVAVVGALAVMVFRDLSPRRMRAFRGAAFSWKPGEAYFGGKGLSQMKDEKLSEEKK